MWLIVIAFAILLPSLANASSARVKTVAPTAAQRTGILKAFGDPKAAGPCLNVRLASANHGYATVRVRGGTSCQRWAFNGVNVIKRRTDNHWKVVFEGSSYHCPVARIPRSVQRDLGVCS
jgi:hypothetical protein